jgi:c-di-GMP-binding flagellar brake protein YcgR
LLCVTVAASDAQANTAILGVEEVHGVFFLDELNTQRAHRHCSATENSASTVAARQDSAHHMLRIGTRFVDLRPQQEQQIARFIAAQQRKRQRHTP